MKKLFLTMPFLNLVSCKKKINLNNFEGKFIQLEYK